MVCRDPDQQLSHPVVQAHPDQIPGLLVVHGHPDELVGNVLPKT